MATIPQIAAAYNISGNHLMKVVHQLGQAGYIETVCGWEGGMRLARPAADVVLGDVIRFTEADMDIVPCFAPENRNVRCRAPVVLRGRWNTHVPRFSRCSTNVRLPISPATHPLCKHR